MTSPDDRTSRARARVRRLGPNGLPAGTDLRAWVAASTARLLRNPDEVEALIERGTALVALGSRDGRRAREAEADFDRALALEPGNAAALGGRAAARFSRCKTEKLADAEYLEALRGAVADWTECLRSHPDDPRNLAGRAFALHDLALAVPEARAANFRRALDDLDRSLALLPDNGDALVIRGAVRDALQVPDGASLDSLDASIADYERAAALDACRPGIFSRLAAARAQAAALRIRCGQDAWGDFSRAVRELDSEPVRGPASDTAVDLVSSLVAGLAASLPDDPRLPPVHCALRFARAKFFRSRGQDHRAEIDVALGVCEDILRRSPDSAGAHANYGQALALTGRYEQARRELVEALRLDPGMKDARKFLEMLDEGAP